MASQATSRDAVLKDTPTIYTAKSALGLIKPSADYVKSETAYYLANVSNVKSIDDLMADKRLLNFALSSFGLDPAKEKRGRSAADAGRWHRDPDSSANKLTNKAYAAFVSGLQLRTIWRSGHDHQCAHSSRRSTNTCARRWKRMPARTMKASGWRSISIARRRR